MDFDRMREFQTIAQTGSFRKAAEELGISPSVLSARFQAFERSLNTELFTRTSRSVTLTETGTLFLQNVDDLLSSWETTAESLQAMNGHTFRSLHLQLCAQTMASELGPFLDQYCRKHPRLFLDLYDENTCTIREGIFSGRVDIAFAVGREDDFSEIAGRITLTRFPNLYVYVAADHPLAAKTTVRFAELSGETFILYPNMVERCTRELQRSLLDQSGIEYQIYAEECSPYFFDLLVPIGKGVRLWNWREWLTPNTASLLISDAGFDTYLYLLYDPATENPTTLHFIERFLAFRKERL